METIWVLLSCIYVYFVTYKWVPFWANETAEKFKLSNPNANYPIAGLKYGRHLYVTVLVHACSWHTIGFRSIANKDMKTQTTQLQGLTREAIHMS